MPPENLRLSRFLFAPAHLPGLAAFWAVFERLDRAAITHCRYLGTLPVVDGEPAASLNERAAHLAASGVSQ